MEKPVVLSLISHLAGAAIILQIGWWLKANDLFGFGDWVVSLFH